MESSNHEKSLEGTKVKGDVGPLPPPRRAEQVEVLGRAAERGSKGRRSLGSVGRKSRR